MVEATLTEIRYGFNACEQKFIFKCRGTKILLQVTNPVAIEFMRWLSILRNKIKVQNPRAYVIQSELVEDIETPYSVSATNADEQWEKLYEAFRAEQAPTGGSGDSV